MNSPDNSLKRLELIYKEFDKFFKKRGAASEADTRHKIIDRIIHEVLLWPHASVKCEERTDIGFMDYVLYSGNRSVVVIEAKKAGETWSIPKTKYARRVYELSGVISKDQDMFSAIEQVQAYCNNEGIRYAIASNGYSFIIFRAISELTPWRRGRAIVFNEPGSIIQNFALFWDLLAYENITAGSLDNFLLPKLSLDRIFDKPLSHIANADAHYGRNIISSLLQPYIENFFGDIAAQRREDILETCYIYSESLKIIDEDLKIVINDEIPGYAARDGFQELNLDVDGGELSRRLKEYSEQKDEGGCIIIMGGIGCGKSTYLRRFMKLVSQEETRKWVHFIYLNYLAYSPKIAPLNQFTYERIAENIRSQGGIISRDVLELIYQEEIAVLKETKLYSIDDERAKKKEIGHFLFEKMQNSEDFSEKALRALVKARVLPVLIFDNVDQLPLDIQIEIFGIAQYFSRRNGCLSILALREESYHAARMQRVLTAYALHRYHISSPNFRTMINVRISRALQALSADEPTTIKVHGEEVSKHDVKNFLEVVYDNLFRPRGPIMSLIQSMSFGNMRFALDILNRFMTSGTTDVGKILIKHLAGGYTVAFHEFVKSVALGEYRYYKETRSYIVNLYDIQAVPNASHFTALRLLKYLAASRDVLSPEGQGFVDINQVIASFEDLFGSSIDVKCTIEKLIALTKQLVELDTRSTDDIAGSSFIRITSAGLFYINTLYKDYMYLDLVWQDTPINDTNIARSLARQMQTTDLEQRFQRVEMFLEYLKNEEADEFERYALQLVQSPLAERFFPTLFKSFVAKRSYIRSRRALDASK